MNELELCAAAFFRSKGKNVMTSKEFLMGISMNNRWMPYSEAERLLGIMISSRVVIVEGEYIRPSFDIGNVDVPIGYRPSKDILGTHPVKEDARAEDVFQSLLSKAERIGLKRKDFLSDCRMLQKELNVDVEVAALTVLRDNGCDISEYIDIVRNVISKR